MKLIPFVGPPSFGLGLLCLFDNATGEGFMAETFRIDVIGPKVTKYGDEKEAMRAGNGGTLVSSEEQLVKSGVLMATMVELFNLGSPTRLKNVFKDREEAAKAVWPLLEKCSEPAKPRSQSEKDLNMAKTPKAPAAQKAPAKKAAETKKTAAAKIAPKGKASAFAGKTISLSPKCKGENVRKEGTGGWNSMEIVRKAGKISYEDFVAKGGRRQDLAWDADRGSYDLK